LVKSVDELIGRNGFDEEVFAQIGESSYRPHNFEGVSSLEKRLFDKRIREASGIIGEVINDHQVTIARKFEELGHILVAYNAKDLPDGIRRLKNFIPQKRKANPGAVVDRIGRFLNSLSESRQRQDQHWRWK